MAFIVEIFGGLGWRLRRHLKFIACSAGDKARGRDGTDYGRARRSPGHLVFHARRIACKAVFGDAEHIFGNVQALKMKAHARIATAARVAGARVPEPTPVR